MITAKEANQMTKTLINVSKMRHIYKIIEECIKWHEFTAEFEEKYDYIDEQTKAALEAQGFSVTFAGDTWYVSWEDAG